MSNASNVESGTEINVNTVVLTKHCKKFAPPVPGVAFQNAHEVFKSPSVKRAVESVVILLKRTDKGVDDGIKRKDAHQNHCREYEEPTRLQI